MSKPQKMENAMLTATSNKKEVVVSNNSKENVIEYLDNYSISLENRIIKLRHKDSSFSRKNKFFKVCPITGKNGQIITGQPFFTEEEKRKVPLVITKDTLFHMKGVVTFDLSNPIDVINWNWIKEIPFVSKSILENDNMEKIFMYIDEVKEAEIRVSKAKADILRKHKVLELSLEDKRKLSRVLLFDADSLTEQQVDDILLTACEKDIRTSNNLSIDELLADNKKLEKIYYAYLLIDKQDITFDFSGYHSENKLIAKTFDDYLEWLNNSQNNSYVTLLLSKYAK